MNYTTPAIPSLQIVITAYIRIVQPVGLFDYRSRPTQPLSIWMFICREPPTENRKTHVIPLDVLCLHFMRWCEDRFRNQIIGDTASESLPSYRTDARHLYWCKGIIAYWTTNHTMLMTKGNGKTATFNRKGKRLRMLALDVDRWQCQTEDENGKLFFRFENSCLKDTQLTRTKYSSEF